MNVAEFSGPGEMVEAIRETITNKTNDLTVVRNCASIALCEEFINLSTLGETKGRQARTDLWRRSLPQSDVDILLARLWPTHGTEGTLIQPFYSDGMTSAGESSEPHLDTSNISLPTEFAGINYSLDIFGNAIFAGERIPSISAPRQSHSEFVEGANRYLRSVFPDEVRHELPDSGIKFLQTRVSISPGDMVIFGDDIIHATKVETGRMACLGTHGLIASSTAIET